MLFRLVVVGHHPSDEIDVEDFTALMLDRGISLYVARVISQKGHDRLDDDSI